MHGPHVGALAGTGIGALAGQAIGGNTTGTLFRVLTSQGSGAEGGAMSYLDANGHMTLGYALLAWPASYNETGVMSFIVSKSDVVYQRDFGQDTETEAGKIASFDPSETWQPVE